MIRMITVIALILALCAVAYRYLAKDAAPHALPTFANTPIVIKPSEYSHEDMNFLQSMRSSIKESQKTMDNLNQDITQAETDDEQDEAVDAMVDAQKQTLFHWNMIHNGGVPTDPALQQLKERYESILSGYRQGLIIEMEGMEDGTPQKMKDGFKVMAEAKNALQQLSKTVGDAK